MTAQAPAVPPAGLPSVPALCFPSQALKYAFQTHDRLCFVMEYANGGEVSGAACCCLVVVREGR